MSSPPAPAPAPAPAVRAVLAAELPRGIPSPLPPPLPRRDAVPHAPRRAAALGPADRRQALANALRYFPAEHHALLAPEFAAELDAHGHIYMYRLRPTEYAVRSYTIRDYPAQCEQAAAIMLMVMNVLDDEVAMYPDELVTYGGNGSVFSNWAQYRLAMRYLARMDARQTLVLCSGHPQGLYPSHGDAPRMVVTNGMMVPNYSTREQYDRLYAMGCTQYGQMTAGSFCYIGSQGIVHGTTITIKNAGRKYLGLEDLHGKVFVSSGLGGMSGAQPKAAVICDCIAVVAEVDPAALEKRYAQGWVQQKVTTLDECVAAIRAARRERRVVSIGYLGNVVSLWERLAAEAEGKGGEEGEEGEEGELLVELGSDQTSLHDPFGGGYCPVQLSFEEARRMISADPPRFAELVQESLRRHVAAINALAARGMRFWDYGNGFLLEASRAKADVLPSGAGPAAALNRFRYPSYVQDIMGDIFSLGFGPFRWVCSSNDPADLKRTDELAAAVMRELEAEALPLAKMQIGDNIRWIEAATANRLVVGNQARILYADCEGRQRIARRFNAAVADGTLAAPVVLSRDHHDVSGTDSPFRETSDIYDGSAICADMAIQNVIGDAARGATWVAIHNGGGVGWGEVTNGGFGLVLDGTADAERRATQMLQWDVLNGVGRRSWAGNRNGRDAIVAAMEADPRLHVTVPETVDTAALEGL